MNEPTNPARSRVKTPMPRFCECSDPGCPVCRGHCRRIARSTVFRSDMEDATGTPMCEGCAQDALDSGVFHTLESLAPLMVNILLEWGPLPSGEMPDVYDARMVSQAIRHEMRNYNDYETAKNIVLQNLAKDPEFYAGIVGQAVSRGVEIPMRAPPVREGILPRAKVKAPPQEWAAGKKVEREHTTDPETATDIASHHLKERPDYYRKLKKAGLADELKDEKPTKATMLFRPPPGTASVEPMKEPPGSAADLKLRTRPRPKAAFYPSAGGPSSV